MNTKPESTVGQTIKLRNNTDGKIDLTIEIKKMGADETGNLTIKDGDDGTLSWIEIKEKKISVPPREWINIPFSIKVPENAAFGYYWAVSFTQVNSTKQTQTGAKVNAAIVVPILLNVEKDGAVVKGKLESFKTDKSFYEYPPVTFKTTFSNQGNVHFAPRGNVFIKDFFGREVAILEVNNSNGMVLPNLTRSFEASWSDSFIYYQPKLEDGQPVLDKNGEPEKELKIDFKKILDTRIGKYNATAVLLISGKDRDYTYEETTTFFVFPWKVVIGALIFVILAGVGLFSTLRTIVIKLKKLFSRNK